MYSTGRDLRVFALGAAITAHADRAPSLQINVIRQHLLYLHKVAKRL